MASGRVLLAASCLLLAATACNEADQSSSASTSTTSTVPPTTTPLRFELTGGCSAAVFWARSADDTQAIRLYIPLDNDTVPGEGLNRRITLPASGVLAVLQRGQHLSQSLCGDVVDTATYRLDDQSNIVSGTIDLVVDPVKDPARVATCGATATATLTDLVVDSGERLPNTVLSTDSLGCMV